MVNHGMVNQHPYGMVNQAQLQHGGGQGGNPRVVNAHNVHPNNYHGGHRRSLNVDNGNYNINNGARMSEQHNHVNAGAFAAATAWNNSHENHNQQARNSHNEIHNLNQQARNSHNECHNLDQQARNSHNEIHNLNQQARNSQQEVHNLNQQARTNTLVDENGHPFGATCINPSNIGYINATNTRSQNLMISKSNKMDFRWHTQEAAKSSSTGNSSSGRLTWRVPQRYSISKQVGSGSYGTVCVCRDLQQQRGAAMKKLKRIFEDLVDCKRLLREIAILRQLDDDRIVRIYDVCVPEGDPVTFTELYWVMELADFDFKKLFRLRDWLTEQHVTKLLHNTLAGVSYIHSAGIYHRDLKPANCLVNKDCSVKICDFGLSRPAHDPGRAEELIREDAIQRRGRALTAHVVTRWYRAPELILLQDQYDQQIDVWSLGCIYGELLGMLKTNIEDPDDRKPLFQGSTCYPLSPDKRSESNDGKSRNNDNMEKYYSPQSKDQLNVIFQHLGTPDQEFIEKLDKDDARKYVRRFRARDPVLPLDTLPRFQGNSRKALDLLKGLLHIDPDRRLNVDQALQHPLFMEAFDDLALQPARRAENRVRLQFEEEQMSEPMLRYWFMDEVRRWHPEAQSLDLSAAGA